jgi:hypothetical protein
LAALTKVPQTSIMGNEAIAKMVALLQEEDKETAKLEMQLETPMEEEGGGLDVKRTSPMQKETLLQVDALESKKTELEQEAVEMQLETPMQEVGEKKAK